MNRLVPLLFALTATACSAGPVRSTSPSTAASMEVTADAELGRRVDAAIDAAIREHRIVGAVALIARDGRIVHRRAAGFLDREGRMPMREDAIFRYASMTKPIVSAAALALIEDGKLSLDDTLERWLPELQFRSPSGAPATITIRQLLTHTAGFDYGFLQPPDGPYVRAGVSDGLDQPGLSFAENARRLASVPLSYEPGTSFRYSLADDVLGEIVARAGGDTLPNVVIRKVTEPLGMHDTRFAVTDRIRLAVAYADGETEPVRMADTHTVTFGPSGIRFAPGRILDAGSYPSGGAGMAGTASDFLTFLEALRTGGGRVLGAASARAMTSNQIGSLGEPALGPGRGYGFGVSVMVDPERAGLPVPPGTYQWGGAYGHSWWVDPTNRITAVILTNTAVEGMSGRLPLDVQRAVYAR